MALLFVLWIFARNLLYAALQATVIWTLTGVLGQALSWILIWQILTKNKSKERGVILRLSKDVRKGPTHHVSSALSRRSSGAGRS